MEEAALIPHEFGWLPVVLPLHHYINGLRPGLDDETKCRRLACHSRTVETWIATRDIVPFWRYNLYTHLCSQEYRSINIASFIWTRHLSSSPLTIDLSRYVNHGTGALSVAHTVALHRHSGNRIGNNRMLSCKNGFPIYGIAVVSMRPPTK